MAWGSTNNGQMTPEIMYRGNIRIFKMCSIPDEFHEHRGDEPVPHPEQPQAPRGPEHQQRVPGARPRPRRFTMVMMIMAPKTR
jgi:hypothetical protein